MKFWVVRQLFDLKEVVASARVLEVYLTRMLTAIRLELDPILEVGKGDFDRSLPVNQRNSPVSVMAEFMVIVWVAPPPE